MSQPPINLREDTWPGCKPGKYFQRGRFLKIDEIKVDLEAKRKSKNVRDQTLSLIMLRNINAMAEDPLMQFMRRSPAKLTVSRLQHVTGLDGFQGITNDGGFKGKAKNISATDSEIWQCFSWWSIVVSQETITSIRENWRHRIPAATLNQFPNSPVFDSESRYGNFTFSFPVEDLLRAYSEQHCSGETPVFRVLGTWTYQQEIAHTILVHSAEYNHVFSDFPDISADPTEAIYRVEDGTFMCNLESTCSKIDGTSCVWNNPIFAFYLPGFSQESQLKLDFSRTTLTACSATQDNYMQTRGARMPVSEANKYIQSYFEEERNANY
ncbi:uncharacterized protein [Ambystoma mexicanum]|uniref:uncharacterized protein n=1 Tax=Ambystoma mexicanum TaxID=8296 RepID=UPI0037E93390